MYRQSFSALSLPPQNPLQEQLGGLTFIIYLLFIYPTIFYNLANESLAAVQSAVREGMMM